MLLRGPSRLVVPAPVRDAVDARVAAAHPEEAGGYLVCVRRGDALHVTDHVPLENDATDPHKRFVTTVDPTDSPEPRVFYHSHTSATTPSGLSATDRANIPDRLALVVFAPHGTPHSYRLFRRGAFNWGERPVELAGRDRGRLPRLR